MLLDCHLTVWHLDGAMDAQQRRAPHVLIVEDDARLLSVLKELLDDAGYEAETALDGHVAIQKLSTFTPDVILLDLEMTFVNGYEVLEWMKRNGIRIPVVLSTLHDEVGAAAVGAVLKLSKPFTLEQLLDAVTLALATKARGSFPPRTMEPHGAGG